MIGVIADSAEQDVISEFFELFKTPWEFYRSDRRYDVLLCAQDSWFDDNTKIVLLYRGRKTQLDHEQKIPIGSERKDARVATDQGNRIPIYGDSITFLQNEGCLLRDESSKECLAYVAYSCNRALARIGYDLFREVRSLLTAGQPATNAHIPTIELHIEFLRELIARCGGSVVEIPPIPEGYKFTVCLTHDVDHPFVRCHRWDHTVFGFLCRAVFGSAWKFARGRMNFRDLLTNWAAALKLPFVHLGLAEDFWGRFDACYLAVEKGLHSTFFVIPFKNRPGKNRKGRAPKHRAARYAAHEISHAITRLTEAGCEVGLHGIDAWLDPSNAREELAEIRRLTGNSDIGARMHWLYYDRKSSTTLEEAGAAYDSTIGYNETVGYRAGTTQVYKPLEANRLLELPLHAMDTALFYPAHLGLSQDEAEVRLEQMVENAARFGGCLTINWHDRSLAPERLWGQCYQRLLQNLKDRDAWFATAGQAVSWFRKRRSAAFELGANGSEKVRLGGAVDTEEHLPGLQLRIHEAHGLQPNMIL